MFVEELKPLPHFGQFSSSFMSTFGKNTGVIIRPETKFLGVNTALKFKTIKNSTEHQ